MNGAPVTQQPGEDKNRSSCYKAKKIERRWFSKQNLTQQKTNIELVYYTTQQYGRMILET